MNPLHAQILVGVVIESILIVVTWLLLTSGSEEKSKSKFGGYVLLAVTFCWSFLLGALLTIQQIHYVF